MVIQCALEFAVALDKHFIVLIAIGALAQGNNGLDARILQAGKDDRRCGHDAYGWLIVTVSLLSPEVAVSLLLPALLRV